MSIFAEKQPYIGYDKVRNLLVNKLGEISRIVKIEFPHFLSSEDEYFEKINKAIESAYTNIKSEYVLQRITFVYPTKTILEAQQNDDEFEKEYKKVKEFVSILPLL